jgi:anthranilate phosphoribosyltransferase
MVLRGEADPHQVGAFLMLLRFRGEDAEEITGMVQAVRAHAGLGQPELGVDLDWPSYGAGRTRGAPWFLLAALALARSGVSVLMHGSNDFSSGIAVEDALAALGRCAPWPRTSTGCWTCAAYSGCVRRSTPSPGC